MQSFDVQGMSCEHCVRAVTDAIKQVDGGAGVSVDLAAGRVRVLSGAAPDAEIVRALDAEGYAATPVPG